MVFRKSFKRARSFKKKRSFAKRGNSSIKAIVKRAVKRRRDKVFKLRELKNAEMHYDSKYSQAPILLTDHTGTGAEQLSTNNCWSVMDAFNVEIGAGDLRKREGIKIQPMGIDYFFSLGNTPTASSPNYWSGIITMVVVKEKVPGGFAPITYTGAQPSLKFPLTTLLTYNSTPDGQNTINSLLGYYSTKFYHRKIETPNYGTISNGYDQGANTYVNWHISFKVRKQMTMQTNNLDGYTGKRKFIFFIYYPNPWTFWCGTKLNLPKVQGTYLCRFKDL